MKKFFLPFFLLHLTAAVNAATYYFSSSSGDDSRTATQAKNSSTPWKTITKLNSIMTSLNPGDSVLFKSGDTFAGGYSGINVSVSGTSSQRITFGSYGTGAKPVISGFSLATNWTQVRTNVWEAPFYQPNGKENMVISNNQQQGIGRYPNLNAGNGGYLNIDASNGSTQITCNSLPSSPNWAGADIVIRKTRWSLDRTAISSQSGTTLNFAAVNDGNIIINYGFFIVNSSNTLDQNGEWYYDNSRSKLQMYFANNNPGAYNVQASTVETLVNIPFQNYITFTNLSFVGADSCAFKLTNSNNVTINNCNINFTGIDAVNALSSGYLRIEYCNITNTNNNGTNLYWNCNNAVIQYDTLKNTALIPGMGQNGGWGNRYQGILIVGTNNLIQYCELDSTGHSGIHFEGDWTLVQKNYVNTFGLTVDDCGGIYTTQARDTVCNSKSILNNIAVNGISANKGTDDSTYTPAYGIYLDDSTNSTAALNNTTANCAGAGFFSHHNNNVAVKYNTFYNNGKEQFLAVRTSHSISNVTCQNNIFFSKTASQLTSRLESYNGMNDLPQIGAFDSNYYCRPIDTNYMFYTLYDSISGSDTEYISANRTLSTWQSFLGLDLHSHGSPATIPLFTATNLSGVNLFPNGSFTSNANGVGVWSPIGNATVSWLSNKLTAGTAQVSSTNYSSSNGFYITLSTSNTVTAGQGYLLSFTLQGATSGNSMNVYLRQGTSPYGPMSTSTLIPVTTSVQNVQLAFTPTVSGQVYIEMDVLTPTGAIWLDNVMLQTATITPTNPDNYIVFQYNPGSTTKSFTLSGTYLDAKGAAYSGTVTLQPYTSLVLFKQSSGQGNKVAQQSIALGGGLVDAATNTTINSTTTKLNWKVDNQDGMASYYEVQRSSDAQNFTIIGKATAKKEGSSIIYEYQDASPLAGKNYYRITQRNTKDSVSLISQTVVVKNLSFRINPNPVKDIVHVSFDGLITASDNLDKEIQIRNEAGVIVQTVRFSLTGKASKADINVASLQKGLYILSISSEGKSFSKKFIKE